MSRLIAAAGLMVLIWMGGLAMAVGSSGGGPGGAAALAEAGASVARDALQAKVADVKITDRKFLAGVMVRERKGLKVEQERLSERKAVEKRRRVRIQRERETRRAKRARQARLKKKRRIR